MKTLLLMRHAKSSWKQSDLDDHDRPLSQRGRTAAPRMGRLLRDEDLVPGLILSSTANRARTTAALVAEGCGYRRAVEIQREIYGTTPRGLVEVLQDVEEEPAVVLLIGHNPALEALIAALTGRDEPFPTAAIAQLALPVDAWHELELHCAGVLVNLWRPKELED